MKQGFPKLAIAAWIIIGFWVTRSLIFRMANIDFATTEIAENFKFIWFILIPLAIGVLIANSWNGKNPGTKQIVGLTVGISVSICVVFIFNFINGFCACRYSKVVYRHKTENIQIRERIFDCGAWDSDPNIELVETYFIGNYLIKYSEIKKEDIDAEEWIIE